MNSKSRKKRGMHLAAAAALETGETLPPDTVWGRGCTRNSQTKRKKTKKNLKPALESLKQRTQHPLYSQGTLFHPRRLCVWKIHRDSRDQIWPDQRSKKFTLEMPFSKKKRLKKKFGLSKHCSDNLEISSDGDTAGEVSTVSPEQSMKGVLFGPLKGHKTPSKAGNVPQLTSPSPGVTAPHGQGLAMGPVWARNSMLNFNHF